MPSTMVTTSIDPKFAGTNSFENKFALLVSPNSSKKLVGSKFRVPGNVPKAFYVES